VAKWIEIPAKRILAVPREEFREMFRRVGENGEDVDEGAIPYLIIRRADSKVFKQAAFIPLDNSWQTGECNVYLEQI